MSFHTLMFGWEYPPLHLGGLGVACQGLVRGLLKHGNRVTLVLPNPHTADDSHLNIVYPTEEITKTIRIKSMLSPYDSREEYAVRFHALPRESSQIYGEDLCSAIEQYTEASVAMTKHIQPDVVHSHDWMTYEAGMRASAHHDAPLVAHIHATELDRTHFQPDEWIYRKERKGFEAAKHIIAVSQYTKTILTDHYGIAADKISVVHNGNSDEFVESMESIHAKKTTKHAPMILFLGRLTIQKGPWQFLDMAAEVHRLRPDVQFVIAGDGNMLGELIERTCELGLQESVIFAGKVHSKEAKKLYDKADCFVMPSVSEPFGLVALEAIASGTPVILSKQSGVSEVVGHAFTVDFWDTKRMADCALTILREDALADQLRSEATSVLQNLTWQNQSREVQNIYQKLVCHA